MADLNLGRKVMMTGFITAMAIGMTGCATGGSNVIPIIDAPDTPKLRADLSQCQSLAAQYQSRGNDQATAVIVGAGIGALTGATINNRRGRSLDGDGALIGGAIGGAAGFGYDANRTQNIQEDIVYRCMVGRGYRVLA